MSLNPPGSTALEEEEKRERDLFLPTHTEEKPCEDIGRRQSYAAALNLELTASKSVRNRFL